MIDDSITNELTGRNILVTGGTGMIGRQLVALLSDAGAQVRLASLDRLTVDERAEHVYADLTDRRTCEELVVGMDDVCHVAGIKGSAQMSHGHIASHFVPTLMMNVNVLHACQTAGIQRVVYTSSIGAYSQAEIFSEDEPGEFHDAPMDFAGWAKRMGELQVHAYRLQYDLKHYSVVRPCNVYGPGDNFDPETAMVVGALLGRVLRGENPIRVWGDGSAIRDFAYSGDVAEGLARALVRGTGGRYVNLGSGDGHSIRDLVEAIAKITGVAYEFDPSKPAGYPRRVMDISLARELIGYEPSTSLEDGLRQTWSWLQENKDEFLKRKNYFRDE